MNRGGDGFARRLYGRLWAVLVEWLRVPNQAPELPARPDEQIERFHPATGFLRYLKLWFWLGLVGIDLLIAGGWVGLVIASPLAGVLLFPVALILAVVPDVIVYVALHVRYDTTWYVMTERSLRIRRGVWTIQGKEGGVI